MLARITSIVVDVVASFFVFLLLARFHFQWLRVPFRNQAGEFIIATTNWIVKPARRMVPALLGLDLASWFCAWLLQALALFLLFTIAGRDFSSAPGIAAAGLFALALVDLAEYSVKILLFLVIVQAVLSWFSSYNPMQPVFDAATRPFLRPIRRFVPPVANVDLSPLILTVVILVLLVPLSDLRVMVAGIF